MTLFFTEKLKRNRQKIIYTMSKKFDFRDYIDDIAEESSSSNNLSEDEDYLLPGLTDNEDEDDNDNTLLEETALSLHNHSKTTSSLFKDQCLKDDKKEIKSILERNFKRSKRVDMDNEVITQTKQGAHSKEIRKEPEQPTKFHLGFKKKQLPVTTTPKQLPTQGDSSLQSPNGNEDMLMSLKYSHEKRMKKTLLRSSCHLNEALRKRMQEDEIILKNVVKKKCIKAKENKSQKCYPNHLKLNKAVSFLDLMKSTRQQSKEIIKK